METRDGAIAWQLLVRPLFGVASLKKKKKKKIT